MTPNKIIIHHTASKEAWNLEKYFERLSNWKSESTLWSYIYYDIIIEKDGTHKQHRTLTERSWATKANNASINIAMVWNFHVEKPTTEQIETAKRLIKDIRVIFPDLPVYEHWELDGEHTECAWKHFNTSMLSDKPTAEKKDSKWRITRYYSPTMWQKKFAYSHKLGRRRTLVEELYTQCGYNESLTLEENIENCKYSANGWELLPSHAGAVVACPWRYPFWTKINIEWRWEVTCVDRWGAIDWYRLDIRAWYWEEALNRIETGYWPQRANVTKI